MYQKIPLPHISQKKLFLFCKYFTGIEPLACSLKEDGKCILRSNPKREHYFAVEFESDSPCINFPAENMLLENILRAYGDSQNALI